MDKGDKKEKLIIQAICLLLSIGLWFYVSNVEDSTRTIDLDNVSVQLLGVEDLKDRGLALSSNQEHKINIKIEGQTSDIYKAKKEDFLLQANLEDYALKQGENRIPIKVVDYPGNINIKNPSSLTVKVILDEYKEREVEIKSDLTIKTASGFFVSEPAMSQKSVIVSGPATNVEKVSKVIIRGVIEDVSSNINKSYNLIPVDEDNEQVEGITLSKSSVDVSISVSKGKSVPIKVTTKGDLKEGKLSSIKSSTAYVEINGPDSITSSINEVLTTPVDLTSIKETTDVSVRLVIPEGVSVPEGKDTIKVTVNVEKLESKELTLNVTVKGKKEELDYSITPESIKIKIYDYKDKLDSLTESDFVAEIDVSELDEGEKEITPKISVVGESDVTYEVLSTIKVTIKKI